jgi:carbon storage regulator
MFYRLCEPVARFPISRPGDKPGFVISARRRTWPNSCRPGAISPSSAKTSGQSLLGTPFFGPRGAYWKELMANRAEVRGPAARLSTIAQGRSEDLLVLTRHVHQSIMIGPDVVVTVLEVRGDQVRLGITAPKDVQVHREEVFAALTAASRHSTTPINEPHAPS